jgi:plasmid stabilization system protein ParE
MSSGYALHPEALADLDEIRDYIAQADTDAADRVMLELFDMLRSLVPFPNQGQWPPPAVRRCTRVFDRLRAGREAIMDCRGDARPAQPTRNGGDPAR